MTTKRFTLLQLYSVVDGRLSTSFEEFQMVINHIVGRNISIDEVPAALLRIKMENPYWYRTLKKEIETINLMNDNNVHKVIQSIKEYYCNLEFDIPQLENKI